VASDGDVDMISRCWPRPGAASPPDVGRYRLVSSDVRKHRTNDL